MNLNDFAVLITLKEGKKANINIGQAKELLRIILLEQKAMPFGELVKMVNQVK
jgi:hypothetical protein